MLARCGVDARPTPEEIDELIFAAGLSTVDKVTDISGRGVGMDVVRRNVEALGGRITVHSDPGHGCRFALSLPLTLAVLDGMVVRTGRVATAARARGGDAAATDPTTIA